MEYVFAYEITIFEEQKPNEGRTRVDHYGFLYANSYSEAILQLEHYFEEEYITECHITRYEGPLMVNRSMFCQIISELERI